MPQRIRITRAVYATRPCSDWSPLWQATAGIEEAEKALVELQRRFPGSKAAEIASEFQELKADET